MFGLDEAGRGPVLGSLFVGFVDAPTEALPDGLDDSKNLSGETISTLATMLYNDSDVRTSVEEITVETIDAGEGDITTLTINRMAALISGCASNDGGVVDANSTSLRSEKSTVMWEAGTRAIQQHKSFSLTT